MKAEASDIGAAAPSSPPSVDTPSTAIVRHKLAPSISFETLETILCDDKPLRIRKGHFLSVLVRSDSRIRGIFTLQKRLAAGKLGYTQEIVRRLFTNYCVNRNLESWMTRIEGDHGYSTDIMELVHFGLDGTSIPTIDGLVAALRFGIINRRLLARYLPLISDHIGPTSQDLSPFLLDLIIRSQYPPSELAKICLWINITGHSGKSFEMDSSILKD